MKIYLYTGHYARLMSQNCYVCLPQATCMLHVPGYNASKFRGCMYQNWEANEAALIVGPSLSPEELEGPALERTW